MLRKIFNGNFYYFLNNLNRYYYPCFKCNYLSNSCVFLKEEDDESKLKGGVYKVFQDEESPIILDVEEERANYNVTKAKPVEAWDEFYGINLERGVSGVYEIEDLVDVIRRNRAQNVFVVKVPESINYVDYLVVVSCMSKRHIYALTQFVIKVFKKKRLATDPVPRVVGEGISDWVALDLGNIALHIMTEDVREKYDLETLWSVGAKFDDLSLKADNTVLDILQKHSINLDDFIPAKRAS